MRFYIEYFKDRIRLTAVTENVTEMIGNCDVAPYFPVKLGAREISVEFGGLRALGDLRDWESQGKIHPDLIAMLCLVLFYPFCHGKVTFPRPVSVQFAQALLKFPLRRKINGEYRMLEGEGGEGTTNGRDRTGGCIQATHLDPGVSGYSGRFRGAEFDGDVRTAALKSIFPELWLIHQYTDEGKKDGGGRVRELWKENRKFVSVGVKNLVRFTPMACLASSILLGSFLGLGTLVYSPDRSRGEIRALDESMSISIPDWEQLFLDGCGLTVVNYMKGMRILECTRLCYQGGLAGQVVFCQRGKNRGKGAACLKCFECFRHLLYFVYLDILKDADWNDWAGFNYNGLKKDIILLNDPEVNFCLRELFKKGKLPNWLIPFVKFPGMKIAEKMGRFDLKAIGKVVCKEKKDELILRLKTYGIRVD